MTLKILDQTLEYGKDFTIQGGLSESLMVLNSSATIKILLNDERKQQFSQTIGTKPVILEM